ncbi:uncharacterized protein LOC143469273 isoform X1 [Clavelina lepadiformis]|uniref:uncharacterized protein LOC143469273 isoform X1 n=1 Tax=Clavelina lepadiformis TaxID=159417 RepID=UPI004042749B
MFAPVVIIFVSAFSLVFLLILCLGHKKKQPKITTIGYSSRTDIHSESDEAKGANEVSKPSQTQAATENGKNEWRPHSISQSSRELPQLPPVVQETNQRSSADGINAESNESSVAGTPGHSSPKGRRLPTPPPDISENMEAVNVQDDDDMYAKVDDAKKKKTFRMKIKTLEIPEGSGDSSFYAKVNDNVDTEDTDLYAQVDDKTLQGTEQKNEDKESDDDDFPGTSKHLSMDQNSPDKYSRPEYATIDKLKKVSLKRKPAVSDEPPAPPIPERNFDAEDELEDPSVSMPEIPENQSTLSDNDKQGPMYDKLNVRESLDHIRMRKEADQGRYANMSAINAAEASANTDVYAQIDEVNPESLYESVSRAGSADGTFIPSHSNAAYSVIGELPPSSNLPPIQLNGTNNVDQPVRPRSLGADLQTRPPRQHHYEQIERPSMSSSS